MRTLTIAFSASTCCVARRLASGCAPANPESRQPRRREVGCDRKLAGGQRGRAAPVGGRTTKPSLPREERRGCAAFAFAEWSGARTDLRLQLQGDLTVPGRLYVVQGIG